MSDIYYTIKGAGESQYKEKMSRFLSFAIPVSDAEEAKGEVKRFQNRFHDARHVCWAYMIGPDRLEWQLNDNGEPSGTAGKPILGQLLSQEVTDCLIVVVRYFGGTKLGVPGLIAAYRESAADVLAAARIVEKTVDRHFTIRFPYLVMNDVMRIVKEEQPAVLGQEFDNLCTMRLSIREIRAEGLIGRLRKAGAGIDDE